MKILKIAAALVAAALFFPGCAPKKTVAEKLEEFTSWNQQFLESYLTRMEALQGGPDSLLRAYADSASQAYLDYNRAALRENLDNAVGVAALKELYSELELDELAAVLEELTAPVEGADSAFVEKLRRNVASMQTTAEGQMFTDFEVDGVKLSDFVGRGQYILADFWASWCRPCRAEIPNIRAVWKEFKGPRFDVLSIAVWDKPEDTAKAAREEKIQWKQITNAQRIPTELYGIQGIPHIILFGPDGTILKRGLRGAAIREAVAEALAE